MAMRSQEQEVEHNFTYHEPTPEKIEKHEVLRGEFKMLAFNILHVPPSRERSLALTKLEEAMFWANAAIARNG